MQLRPYQEEAINTISSFFKNSSSQYIEMPTGSGKTFTFLTYAQRFHQRILIIVPSRQLLNQVYDECLKFYHSSEISRKGDRFNEEPKKVHICGIHSLSADYLELLACLHFDLIIIDEAHHAQAMMYRRFIKMTQQYANYEFTKILGVTATPHRLDRKLLSDVIGHCSFSLKLNWMIENNYLSDIEGYRIKTKIDISDIDDHNGDFSISLLYKKLCIDSRNELIIKAVKEHLLERKSLIFCINISHSKILNKTLNESGISSAHIDGEMNKEERQKIISRFEKGEIKCMCNCQLLTEGFDAPFIDGILLARPTRSAALFLQMIGRGLRLFPGKKNCKIIDIVDNHKSLSSFNSLLTEEKYPEMDRFKSLRNLEDKIIELRNETIECQIERTNLFNNPAESFKEKEALQSMINYLDENNILYFHPINFDECSFLIWHNELKKEYVNGLNRKAK